MKLVLWNQWLWRSCFCLLSSRKGRDLPIKCLGIFVVMGELWHPVAGPGVGPFGRHRWSGAFHLGPGGAGAGASSVSEQSFLLPFIPEEMLFQIQSNYRLQIHFIFISGGWLSDGYHASIGISKINCVSASWLHSSLRTRFVSSSLLHLVVAMLYNTDKISLKSPLVFFFICKSLDIL